jgi:hypothetical protein
MIFSKFIGGKKVCLLTMNEPFILTLAGFSFGLRQSFYLVPSAHSAHATFMLGRRFSKNSIPT